MQTTATAVAAPLASGEIRWHTLGISEGLTLAGSSPEGLTSVEAARRLATLGRNELATGRRLDPLHLFARQFLSPLVGLLVAAAVIAGIMGDAIDCAAIAAILVLNAVIGFQQEFRAEKAIAALKTMTAPQARVHRDGTLQTIPSAEIVPGDVIEVAAGDVVPADALLLEASSLRCMEAALTGESEPVLKTAGALAEASAALGDRVDMIFMGTALATGSGRAVVVATAAETELGQIATLLELPEERTPLQQRLDSFGQLLVWAGLACVALVFGVGLLRGEPAGVLFLTSVSLAVAAVPEGLPAIISIALAIGVRRMARRGTLIRRLPAVETLGCASVICTDKTGTLTMNRMTVRALHLCGHEFEVTGEGYSPQGEVTRKGGAAGAAEWLGPLREYTAAAAACTDARLSCSPGAEWSATGDPTEAALVALAAKLTPHAGQLDFQGSRIRDFSFNPERKSRVILRRKGRHTLQAVVNGAPEMLLARCTRIRDGENERDLTGDDLHALEEANGAMTKRGLRVIGTAVRDLPEAAAEDELERIEARLTFLGLAGIQDPPRAEARSAVALCRSAGVRPVMITGDHPQTALAIGREVGLAGDGDRAITGVELAGLSDAALQREAPRIAVYARVTPADKLRIVRAWRANAAIVAMTGDGVNDAPAIKGADIGIAMGLSGTDVAREAADMVITDDNFSTIVAAIEEGRGVYANIRKTLQYLLTTNGGEVLLVVSSIIVGLPLPLLPVHLLWINLVTDSLPALCLASDPIETDVMARPPRPRSEPIATRSFLASLAVDGAAMAAAAFATYLYFVRAHADLALARTAAFDVLILAQLFLALGLRSGRELVWQRSASGSNWNLLAVIVISIAVQIACHALAPLRQILHLVPLSVGQWLSLAAAALVPLAVHETVKIFRHRPIAQAPRHSS